VAAHVYAVLISNHPEQPLTSCRPIWAEAAPIDVTTQWEEDWLSASVVNQHLPVHPANWLQLAMPIVNTAEPIPFTTSC